MDEPFRVKVVRRMSVQNRSMVASGRLATHEIDDDATILVIGKCCVHYSGNCAAFDGRSHKALLDCPGRRHRVCSAFPGDESAGLSMPRNIDSANRLARAPGGGVGCILPR
jgi:hypothetical protein